MGKFGVWRMRVKLLVMSCDSWSRDIDVETRRLTIDVCNGLRLWGHYGKSLLVQML